MSVGPLPGPAGCAGFRRAVFAELRLAAHKEFNMEMQNVLDWVWLAYADAPAALRRLTYTLLMADRESFSFDDMR